MVSWAVLSNRAPPHLHQVTGGGDQRLRVWPPSLADFLLEEKYEGAVSSVQLSRDAKHLAVGTVTGTLGILDMELQRFESY